MDQSASEWRMNSTLELKFLEPVGSRTIISKCGVMQVCFDDLLVLLDVLLLLLDVLFSSTFVVLADADVVALFDPFSSFDVAEVVLFDALGAMQV